MTAHSSHVFRPDANGLERCAGCGALPHWPLAETACGRPKRGANKIPVKVTEDLRQLVCKLYADKLPLAKIEEQTGIEKQVAGRIARAAGLRRNKPRTRTR